MASKGVYGITRTEYQVGDLICPECFRSWRDDITPSGRCPWEHLHARDRAGDRSTRRRKAVIAGLWG